eukprot:GHVU01084525.1.p1 GENE.GHVU01084525.1~~GHVU01084525.1.p1  ORF type:complete len:123 (-),score=12.03 GHVU01084525.1:377-745(-)
MKLAALAFFVRLLLTLPQHAFATANTSAGQKPLESVQVFDTRRATLEKGRQKFINNPQTSAHAIVTERILKNVENSDEFIRAVKYKYFEDLHIDSEDVVSFIKRDNQMSLTLLLADKHGTLW